MNDEKTGASRSIRSRVQTLEQRLQAAQTVSSIAARLLQTGDIDRQLNDSLADAAPLASADRAYLLQFRDRGRLLRRSHEWCAPGIRPQSSDIPGLYAGKLSWLVAKADLGEPFSIDDTSALPDDATLERESLRSLGVQSLLVMPMGPAGDPTGLIGFEKVGQAEPWRQEDVDLLHLLGQLMSAALERRRSEEALELSLQRQMAILENIPDIAWLKDADGHFIHVNEPFAKTAGRNAGQIVGKTDFDIWPEHLAKRYRSDDAKVVQRRERIQVEEPVADSERGERWIETIKTPILDGNGAVIGTTGIARDVTERKQTEHAIGESEGRYRRLVESLPAVVYRYSSRFGASYWSPPVEEILGYSQEALRADPFLWHDAIHPDDRPDVDRAIAEFETGNEIDLVYRIRDTSGNWHWFHDRSIGRSELDGEIVIEGIAFDVTSEKIAEHVLRDNEEKYRLLVENQTDMVVKVDPEGRFLFVSPSYCHTFGKSEEELLGKTFLPLVHEEDREATSKIMETLFRPPHRCYIEQRAHTSAGWRWLAWADTAVLDQDNQVVAIVGVGRDITERRQAEDALARERERAVITLQSIGDAVITTDARGRIDYLNPIAEKLTGWTTAEAVNRPLVEMLRIINEETGEPAEDPVQRCIAEGRIVGLANHSVLINRSGERIVIEDSAAPIQDSAQRVVGAVLVFKDVTERRRLDRQVAHAATHDSLTGLVNRTEFEQRLDHALAAFVKQDVPSALCYLDLDQFKIVNDAAGHTAGDEMLKQVSALFMANVRSRDTLARLGGDEFGLLLENCPLQNAVQVCEGLIGALADFRFSWGRRRFGVGVSIGLVPFSADVAERAILTSRADMACFAAKDMGRNRVYVYHPEDAELVRRHRDIMRAAELREAIEHGRFVLFAQPIFSASTPGGAPVRYEVLVRLRGKEGKLLSPGAFIPAAERFGLITELDRWIIANALQHYAELGEKAAGAGIAINVSGTSLSDDNLPAFVQTQLTESGVDPSRICFEVTETAAVNRLSQARRFIDDLKKIGCSFALDDFGSGLSSFNYLKQLPVDWLKVDGSFVRNMPNDPVDEAMVRAINQIGHLMNIKTVAEHVENSAVLSAALASGVDFLQGFELGKPVPLEQIGH